MQAETKGGIETKSAPDAAMYLISRWLIRKADGKVTIDYDFCKGCGIIARKKKIRFGLLQ
jgi:Pyruvate/2-oxoacid:ferredoxin oxidoreductase delta subunit